MKRLAFAVVLAVLSVHPAYAQPQQSPCMNRDEGLKYLADEYGETVQMRGLTSNGLMFEVVANVETGTFTVILSNPAGIACQKAAGSGFQLTPAPPAVKDEGL